MLKNYFKIAFRNLQKYTGYSVINIFGLSTGIALGLLIFLFVKHELSYDDFHQNADRVFGVTMQIEDRLVGVTPSVLAPALDQQFPEVEDWVRLYEPTRFSPVVIRQGENIFQEDHFMYADSSFFDVFTYPFIYGNPETALNHPRNIVLTRSAADKLFGDSSNATGSSIEGRIFNEAITFEVTGVIEDIPENSHLQFDYLASLSTRNGWSQLSDTEVQAANFFTYLLLDRPGAESSLKQKFPDFVKNTVPEYSDLSLDLISVRDIYLSSGIQLGLGGFGSKKALFGFSALAFLILLIAITNYINLSTARASGRAGEVGVRKTLGADRGQLFRQFYSESVLITLISVGIAIGLVEFFKDPFFSIIGKEISLSLFTETSVWMMILAVTMFTAFAAGGYPALVLSSYQPQKVLKGVFSSKGSDAVLRKGLVIFQFAASVFLMLGTIVIYQQTDYILNKDLGFNQEQIVILPAGDDLISARRELLKSEVLRRPGVIQTTYMSNIPGGVFGGYTAEYVPGGQHVSTSAGAADADVVETLNLELLAGPGFPKNPAYSTEQGYIYLINETLAQSFGWNPEEAIDKEFNVRGNRHGKIVGVVKDFNFASLKEEIEPLALFMQPAMYDYLLVKISPGNFRSTIAGLGEVWENLAPHRPFEIEFLDQSLDALYASEVRMKNTFMLFAGFAVFIACLGLLGLSSYTIEKRTKEIGIRKVLGASMPGIVGMLSVDFLKLAGIGFIVAIPIAWYMMNQWLADFAYRIAITPWMFIFAGLAAAGVTILTVSWQSVKAAMKNPVNSLRSE